MHKNHFISSPDQSLRLEVGQDIDGRIWYSLSRGEQQVIDKSFLELFDENGVNIIRAQTELESEVSTFDEIWQQVWGQNEEVRNNYNQLLLKSADFNITFRLFDDGLGFRYSIKKHGDLNIKSELTEFNVDKNSTAWWIPALEDERYEYLFRKTSVSELPTVHTPLTMKLAEDLYISIHEAALYDYGSMIIQQNETGLVSKITPRKDGLASRNKSPFELPWRVIMVANSAINLTTKYDLVLNLNDPPKINTSWIKPTKFMGIWWSMHLDYATWAQGERHAATTLTAMKYINACKELGIEGLLIEGWNEGWDGNWLENSDKMRHLQPAPDFDIHLVSQYARSKNIELIGHHETVGNIAHYEYELPEAYEYYRQLGVKYVKTGYASPRMTGDEFHHSQIGVNHYQKTVEMAARNQIMLNIHEPIKGTGIERTWPNLMTREGAVTHEYGFNITPEHTAILPFIRMLAGPIDYSSGLFKLQDLGRKKQVKTTLAKQLAFYVTLYSPLQFVADLPENYLGHPAFEFIRDVPVEWQETLPLQGEIGEYFVVARKDLKSQDWYIGGVSDENLREIELKLDFLDENADYRAKIYRDDETSHFDENPHAFKIDERVVNGHEALALRMAPGGGFAIRLQKI